MQVIGTVKVINQEQTFGEKGFRKRELVVTTDEQYPQSILIELVQDKCDLINNFKVGDKITVSINLRGREWTNPQGEVKYFNSIQGWRIEAAQAARTPAGGNSFETTSAPAAISNEPDDLPF